MTTPAWRVRLGNGAVLAILLAGVLALGSLHDFQPLHTQPTRIWAATLVALGYTLWSGTIWWRGIQQARATAESAISAWKVAYASQTGYALSVAAQTCAALEKAGISAHQLPIEALTTSHLQDSHVLFVVSTTGEGDAPDHALGVLPMLAESTLELSSLRYAVLALGDQSYAYFCAFGRTLDARLRQLGAEPLFDRVEVDNADAAAIRQWQQHLALLTGDTTPTDWSPPPYQAWPLRARQQLNLGSPGDGAWLIDLAPPQDVYWQAGDIAEISPRHATALVDDWLTRHGLSAQATPAMRLALTGLVLPESHDGDLSTFIDTLPALPHREYSIASIPSDGILQLLVRRVHLGDGRLGLGSGWLTEHASMGENIAIRLRSNPSFHAPKDDCPMILIGNGTGMAGLRALLRERESRNAHRNWLLFGERTRQYDCFFEDELRQWRHNGHLERLDLAFSRDPPQRVYVQDHVRLAAEEIRRWVQAGAAIYVCGSLDGMAPAVDAELQAILGQAALLQLRTQGRYRRDIY